MREPTHLPPTPQEPGTPGNRSWGVFSMSIYEEIEFEDLEFDDEEQHFTYPCPCGDKFIITLAELWDGEDVAPCPSCTLRIRIIYDEENLPPLRKAEGFAGGQAVGVH